MTVQHSVLCRFPSELLELVALHLVLIDPFALPADLLRLGATCKQIYYSLKRSHALGAAIYKAVFDSGAAARRLGPRGRRSKNLSDQLWANYWTLSKIRGRDVDDPNDHETLLLFWQAFILLTEDDGNNRRHLDAAGLVDFVDSFVRRHLYDGVDENNGWPVDDPLNSLALWLMSMTMTTEKLASETPQEREEIIDLIQPYVFAPCCYTTAFVPENYYDVPLSPALNREFPTSMETAHGPYPVHRDDSSYSHFIRFRCSLEIYAPLITVAAKHIYFARRGRHLSFHMPSLPERRLAGLSGPIQSDLVEWNMHRRTKLFESAQTTEVSAASTALGRSLHPPSSRWDHTWERLISCSYPWDEPWGKGPVFSLGALDGLWAGCIAIPELYEQLITDQNFPIHSLEADLRVTHEPLYMRLHEHHSINPNRPLPTGGVGDGFDDGLFNAYLPNVYMKMNTGFLDLTDGTGNTYKYETFVPGRRNSHNEWTCTTCIQRRESGDSSSDEDVDISPIPSVYEADFAAAGLGRGHDDDFHGADNVYDRTCYGVQDVIITGTTDPRHSVAWGSYQFLGRIRRWDGLIAIVRVPTHTNSLDSGRWVFTGYLDGSEIIVGSWRVCNDIGAPSFEGPFHMSKVAE